MSTNEPRLAARRLAASSWGEVQHEHKLTDGIWEYNCSAHGGIIVDTAVHPELTSYNAFVPANTRNPFSGYQHEQHFAPFEEDADWVIPSAMFFPEIYTTKLYNRRKRDYDRYRGLFDQPSADFPSFAEWMKRQGEIITSVVQRHYPDIASVTLELVQETVDAAQ